VTFEEEETMLNGRGGGACWGALLLALVATTVAAATPEGKAGMRSRGPARATLPQATSLWELEALPEAEVQVPEATTQVAGFEGAAITDDGRIQVMVELLDPPAAAVYAEAMQVSEPGNLSVRAAAASVTGAQIARIKAAQSAVAAAIASPAIAGREIYRVQKALNGIAVAVAPDRLKALRALPGVKRVLPILAEYPTNSTSVPFIGAPSVWANTIGLPAGADGAGVRIGVIDTGIDYMHPNFGGPGATAPDYAAERTDTTTFTTVGTATAGPFPTTKVVGGTDLAGDAYTGGNAPAPDTNPMDCNGHGSHVAGSAAGLGMTAGNTTFAGPYSQTGPPYSSLAIGPGVAPGALLYGVRVFGCFGSTGLTTQAIDWTLDPNGDNDLSDHLDVINMSLGSNFGSAIHSSAVASDNAALAGVIVVTSAGNSGDTFFISGSPGSGSRVIATAASVDSGQSAVSVLVNSPGSIAGSYLGGAASFGPAPSGQTADAVIGLDATSPAACGSSATDGCCALTNAAAMAGMICVVDRGTCNFTVKAANCQAAGAIGMIVIDNAPGSPPPGLGGTDPTITIPSERVTLADGTLIKNTITTTPPVNVTLLGQNGADTVASFSSRGPRRIYGSPLRLKPDIAAPGSNITSVQTGITCTTATSGGSSCTGLFDASGIQVGTRSLTISGTSMACPHMAGTMALLRQLHPTWTVEELKALALGYATHDPTLFPAGTPPKFGLARIGAGRVDPALAAAGQVIAMNADGTGMVAVTFEPEAMSPGPVTLTKKVRVVNHGTTSQTYDLAISNIVDSPGVAFSLPGGSSITIGAGQTAEFDVQMTATPSLMDHTRDASLFPTQGVQANYGDQPRNFLTEEGSHITFSQSAAVKFRLPVYMAERPAANMAAADTIVTGGAGTGSTTIALAGSDLCTGTLAPGPTCTGSFPTDVESLVSPFELQVVSPLDPVNSTDYADIQYAGVAFLPGVGSPSLTNDLVMFGVSSWGDWSTPSDVAYDICVDFDQNGVYDKVVINSNPAIFVAGASFNDNFVRVIRDTVTGGYTILGLASPVNLVAPNVIDSALHLNNVMVLGVTPSMLGMTSTTDTDFRYKVYTCPGTNPGCARTTTGDRCSPTAGTFYDQAVGPFYYNWGAQGLNFGGNFLDEDLNGNTLPVSWNTANMTTNGSLGALLLHHHNGQGKRAEVVPLDTAPRADLSVTKSIAPPNPGLGGSVTITITAANAGPNSAASVVVSAPMPPGLTWVSDDGGGAFVPGTGLWTIGVLTNGASAILNITATVATTQAIEDPAEISAGSPLDPNPANNIARFTIDPPDLADLALSMAASSPTTPIGSNVTYTLTLTNNGDGTGPTRPPLLVNLVDGTSFSVNVGETFAGFPLLNPTSNTPSDGVYNPSTGVWNLASLGKGETATLQITVPAPYMIGNLTDQGSASAATSDPSSGNNTAQASTFVISPSQLAGSTKTVSPTSNNFPGQIVTYTITLINNSQYDQFDNPGNEFYDVLPPQVTLLTAVASSGTVTPDIPNNAVSWSGLIPGYGSVTITITAQINAGAEGQTVSNQGSISYDADGDGVNEATTLTDDPGLGGQQDATAFDVATPIPTLTIAGLAALALLVALLGLAAVSRRWIS
jgi:uncharacterized repeat protein (TIGR01451 family)